MGMVISSCRERLQVVYSLILSTCKNLLHTGRRPHATAPLVYYIPPLVQHWSWNRGANPHYELCKAESEAWLGKLMPFSPREQLAFNKCNFARLCAVFFPKASHFNFRSCCDLMNTFFVIDALTDNEAHHVVKRRCDASIKAVLQVDEKDPEGEDIIGKITRQFWRRASSTMPDLIIRRFERYWTEYLRSVEIQAQHREKGYICTFEQYMESRRDNIGTMPTIAVGEHCLGLALADEILDHPRIKTLQDLCSDIITVSNDLFSYRKEVLSGDCDYNAITVVIQHLGLDLDAAIQWISEYHDTCLAEFDLIFDEAIHHQNGFPSWGEDSDRQLVEYIGILADLIRGNYEWSFGTQRYFGSKALEVKRTRKVTII